MRESVAFDPRPTLSRSEARAVYDGFATKGHIGGNDVSSGYGGPAVRALLAMAMFTEAKTVIDYLWLCLWPQGKFGKLLCAKLCRGAGAGIGNCFFVVVTHDTRIPIYISYMLGLVTADWT